MSRLYREVLSVRNDMITNLTPITDSTEQGNNGVSGTSYHKSERMNLLRLLDHLNSIMSPCSLFLLLLSHLRVRGLTSLFPIHRVWIFEDMCVMSLLSPLRCLNPLMSVQPRHHHLLERHLPSTKPRTVLFWDHEGLLSATIITSCC